MDELDRRKMTRKGKVMTALPAKNIRELVDFSNELNIKREDVVTILDRKDLVILIYYK